MAFSSPRTASLLSFLFIALAAALQVTPNSPCSSLCIDDSRFNPADSTLSNTTGTDIVCKDDEYGSAKGQKFQQCLDCLQTSTFGSETENDQAWFIHNLRFAADWCLFGVNNTAKLSGPCMVDPTCGVLSRSLDISSLEPKSGSTYDYCSANDGVFLIDVGNCNSCLKHMDTNVYLSNFLTALKAGCDQRPSPASLIGLDGSVFTSLPINITASLSITGPSTPSTNESSGLSTGAKVGIAVSCLISAIILAAILTIQLFKRHRRRNLDSLNTKFHPRFGATDISAPSDGAYATYVPSSVEDAQHIAMKDVNRSPSPPMSAYTKFSSISSGRSSEMPSPEPLNLAPAAGVGRTVAPIQLQQHQNQQQAKRHVSGPPNPLRMNSYVAPAPASAPLPHTQPGYNPSLAPSIRSSAQPKYNPSQSLHPQPQLRPGYASSILSTSTTFSPSLDYTSPLSYPIQPLPAYNPASYAAPPPPPTHPLPLPPHQDVPIIALPIPAPKRHTRDMREYIGLGISTHVSPHPPLPAGTVPISAVQTAESAAGEHSAEAPPVVSAVPSHLARGSSLLRSASPLRDAVSGLGLRLPRAATPSAAQDAEGVRSESRLGFRRRSTSRPRRERSVSRSGSRREGSRAGFRFEFRGQDAPGFDGDGVSPAGESVGSVEQWPGAM